MRLHLDLTGLWRKPARVRRITAGLMVIISGLSAPFPTYSSEITPQEAALKACDGALTLCDKAIKDQQELVKTQAELLLKQTKQMEELRESRDSVWRHPALWFAVGMLVTGTTVYLIRQ
jgi:hypothetical protein